MSRSVTKRLLASEQDIIRLIEEDSWMMNILHAAARLQLPDWWVCAGFVRSKIWDTLHGYETRTPLPDIDVVYYDSSNLDEAYEKQLEQRLTALLPELPWSVKNEARMHVLNGIALYRSSVDALSQFPETATALGGTLAGNGRVKLAAPCGIEDVLNLRVKPTPHFISHPELLPIYRQRMDRKKWASTWPQLIVEEV